MTETLPPSPQWSLDDLYQGINDPAINEDLHRCLEIANGFAAAYTTQRADTLSGDDLAHAINRYEVLRDSLTKLQSYALLAYDVSLESPEVRNFHDRLMQKTSQIISPCIFFTLDLAKMDDEVLEEKFATSPALAHYRPWLNNLRASKEHDLSEELERYLTESYSATRMPLLQHYAKIQDDARYVVNGRELVLSELLPLLSGADRSLREAAAHAFLGELNATAPTRAFLYNTIIAQEAVENDFRQYDKPWSAQNVYNLVEDGVVDTLFDTVKAAYAPLSHRYYAMKAKWLGLDQLEVWDRTAPLPDVPEPRYTWEQAKQIVLESFSAFSPQVAEVAELFFDHGWIDAAPRAGKNSGAYSHQTASSVHPYILMNFTGRLEDVETLAHELGHGVHQYLYKEQGALMGDVPLTMAEAASVFGEMLVFRRLLNDMTDPRQKRAHIAAKVEGMLGTVVRQISFYDFERQAHTHHQENGNLSVEQLGALWRETQVATYGSSVRLTSEFNAMWGHIPHFFESPFYVYAYAFGDCLVNSLYAVYEAQPQGFADKYIELLKAAGTKPHYELVRPFGLDTRAPGFWQKGLNLIGHYIDELEELSCQIDAKPQAAMNVQKPAWRP